MHQNLHAWQLSMDLAVEIYRLTERFPSGELYGLKAQMRRAAVSVPSNIAEGAGRASKAEFKRFIAIACGSLSELETQLLLSQRLNFLRDIDEPLKTIRSIFNLLSGLRNSLN
ncbi:hypothetical protein GCM10011348_32950 [Marinobacterium nitratireducens]|uniref:Four helix bundle protein n=1 Tax=Marinobacterium nitratireducens TaxID=518897 RepID=A0A917ZK23_9GAMM|nr:four helix bundle protein [Marinobacterium nitratireducens]GGO85124.1 hypothetical protein GCM10011348_32950 [Marinobacterium nitratireducens]